MSTNDAASAVLDNGAGAPQVTVPARMWDRKAGKREWWRFAARPVVLAIGFLLPAVISVVSTYIVIKSRSESALITHALQVQIELSEFRTFIRSAEIGQRGYLLTEDRHYLDAYRNAIDAIMPAFADFKAVTVGNPAHQEALATLEPLVVQKLDLLRETTRLHDAGDSAAALAIVRDVRGRTLMDDIHVSTNRMMDEERRRLELRLAKYAQNNLWLLIANLVGTVFIIALAIISILTVRRMGEEALRDSEKRGDKLRAAVNELDAFSYSVSHDLRTPLRAIDGFSRILLKHHASELAPEPREYLQAVRDNTVQMGHLVDDLLAFARLNRKQLSKKQVPTRTIVEQVVREVQQQAEGRSVSVSVSDLPPVWGDAALLKQVFVNLIDNAFKYTRLRMDAVVEIGSRNIGGEQVIFVRDNGVGFDMQFTSKLFGVFQRLHRAEDFEGTGVGLAIVQRIIHRHGGRVWAEAAVDRGATFYFTMEVPNHA